MEYNAGDIVISMAGHDAGDMFIVLKTEGDYVYIVDGKHRLIDKPKRKKYKHVKNTGIMSEEIKEKIEKDEKISNADIRNMIERNQLNVVKGE